MNNNIKKTIAKGESFSVFGGNLDTGGAYNSDRLACIQIIPITAGEWKLTRRAKIKQNENSPESKLPYASIWKNDSYSSDDSVYHEFIVSPNAEYQFTNSSTGEITLEVSIT